MVKLVSLLNLLIALGSCPQSYAGDYSKTDIERMIAQEAIKQGISSKIAIAVAKTESSLNPKAKGSKGEIGLFQIMPYNAPTLALFDPKVNTKAGVLLLKRSLVQCADMGQYWVICYNNGPNRRPKHPSRNPYYLKIVAEME